MVANTAKVCEALRRFAPTSIEVSDKWTMTAVAMWARRHSIPTVLVSHERLDDMASMFLDMDLTTPVRALNSYLASAYDRVVVTTRYSAGEWLGTRARLVVQSLGVDLDEFVPSSQATPDSGRASRPLSLIYAGRLSREKSPDLAVATAVELDRRGVDVQLHVYGTGPMADELRALGEGAPVFFHGYLDSRQGLAQAYRVADIALSVCPAETFGLAILEALACGTPVVTSDRGGGRESVDATCAQWASPDPAFLAEAVLLMAERVRADPDGMRRAARARAELYPWSNAIDALLGLHHELAQG
jgi:alpha-1,6-mannosyltransferase